MNSIHSHTSDSTDYHLILVGTHRDMVQLPEDHGDISKQITDTFEDCTFWLRVQQPASEVDTNLCFVPIDNTLTDSTKAHDGDRSQLHSTINHLGQQLVESKNNEYPLRWLQVLDDLQQKAEEGVNFMFTDRLASSGNANTSAGFTPHAGADNMLISIAKDHGTGHDTVEYSTLLAFLSEVGSFLPFRNLLIIRPQWIADILFAVVTRPQFQTHIASEIDSRSEWLQFEASAVITGRLLELLWLRFAEPTDLLVHVMLDFDLMLELDVSTNSGADRLFLVPAMLPDSDDLGEDKETGELVRLNGLAAELDKSGSCFENGVLPPASTTTTTTPLMDWPVDSQKPACYFVFEQHTHAPASRAQGFVPEGLWFTLLVRCARWAQQTNAAWSHTHLAKSFRRDAARFSFGNQHFELRLHRAEHAIRLVVLGCSAKYPMGVLQRMRSIIDTTLAERFPVLQYFVALRIQTDNSTKLVGLDVAIRQVEKRIFTTSSSFSSSSSAPSSSSDSGVIAVDKADIDLMTCHPWSTPADADRTFDIYLSHCDADSELACKLFDCFDRFNTTAGNRVRVFLRNVSGAHTSRQITAETAIRHTTVFVPIVSMQAISVCGGFGPEHTSQLKASPLQVSLEYFAVALTVATFISNLVVVLGQHTVYSDTFRVQGWFIVSIVVPRLFNMFFVWRTVLNEQRKSPQFALWLLQNLEVFSIVVLLSCLRLDNFKLLVSTGLGKKMFSGPPPLPIAAIHRCTAFGLISALCGDFPQLVIAVLLLLDSDDSGLTDALMICQIVVSIISLLYQLVLRGLAFVLVSTPHVGQQWIDQITETSQILDCMLATELRKQHSTSHSTCSEGKVAAVLPIVLDEACLGAQFSSDVVSVKVMAQYLSIMGTGRSTQHSKPPHIGELLSKIVSSKRVVKLWVGGGLPVGRWNQCELAAREAVRLLDELAQGGAESSDSNSDGDGSGDDSGHSARRRRRRRWQQQPGKAGQQSGAIATNDIELASTSNG
jgi:hypothetical protein